jgi:hypothetical protein
VAEYVRTILIHPGDRLLPELSPKLAEYAQSKLEKGALKSGCMTGLPAA